MSWRCLQWWRCSGGGGGGVVVVETAVVRVAILIFVGLHYISVFLVGCGVIRGGGGVVVVVLVVIGY